jgi:CRP-like cAMP-binding protein
MTWFVKFVSLREGQSFGELALINDKPRAATIKCEVDAVCGIINKLVYQRVIEKMEK